MLIINDSICRGGAGWDTRWFNSHESRLHIQVSSLQNINSSLFHPRNVQYSKTHSIQLTDINSGRLNQPSSHFTLSPTSGELRTSSRLDREGRDGSDSVDLVALSSSPTYPIEASHLLISNFFHMSLNKWRAGSPIMWVRGGVTDMSEHMGQHQPGRAIR